MPLNYHLIIEVVKPPEDAGECRVLLDVHRQLSQLRGQSEYAACIIGLSVVGPIAPARFCPPARVAQPPSAVATRKPRKTQRRAAELHKPNVAQPPPAVDADPRLCKNCGEAIEQGTRKGALFCKRAACILERKNACAKASYAKKHPPFEKAKRRSLIEERVARLKSKKAPAVPEPEDDDDTVDLTAEGRRLVGRTEE